MRYKCIINQSLCTRWGINASYSMQNGRQTSLSLIGGRQTFASRYDNRNYRISIQKLKTKQIMKREFKKGDRVLVRNHDLQEWRESTFKSIDNAHPCYPFKDDNDFVWSQCRHIDDFRTGDKVQIKSEEESEEWQDAVYACALPGGNHWPHEVYNNAQTDTFVKKFVRWHPSMPWAEKEELTLEQRVEALERKINETFNTKEK